MWGAPLAVGLALTQLSCSGDDHYYQVGNPAYPSTFAVAADMNGDGKVDLVASIYAAGGGVATSGWVTTRLQDAAHAGTYLAPIQSLAGDNPVNLVAAPLSPTGGMGVVVVNRQLVPSASAANTVSVLFPDPAKPGGFLAPVALPVGARNPLDVAVGDLDGDTWPDVVVAADSASSVLFFKQAASGGTFAAPVTLAVGGEPSAVALADLNGDGRLDIVAATAGNNVSVLIQNADGSFQPHVDYAVGTHPVSVKVADLRGTGRKDLVVANYGTDLAPTTKGLSILLQNADGTYAAAITYDTGSAYANWVAVGDLNGDGSPDVAVSCSGVPGDPGSVAVFIQNPGTGTFKTPVQYEGVQGPTSVAIADVDGDGLPDLVLGDGALFVRYQLTGAPGTFGVPYQFRQ
jgi:hypothetical protein